MNRPLRVCAGLLALSVGTVVPSFAAAPKLKSVTLAIRHRVFHQFADTQEVRLNEEFVVGDTDFTATIVRYVPDFAMDLNSRKIVSRSPEPRNPAFEIIVREKGEPRDTTWAMMSLPPHFGRRSFLAFKVMRIDFVGRDAIVADSVQVVKELEALKEAARRTRPTDEGGMPPHGMPPPHPHGLPDSGDPFRLTPAHGSGTGKAGDKGSK